MKIADIRTGVAYVSASSDWRTYVVLSTDMWDQRPSRPYDPGFITKADLGRAASGNTARGLLVVEVIDGWGLLSVAQARVAALIEFASTLDVTGVTVWKGEDGSPSAEVHKVVSDKGTIRFRITTRTSRELGMTYSDHVIAQAESAAAHLTRATAARARAAGWAAELAEAKALLGIDVEDTSVFSSDGRDKVTISTGALLSLARRLTA